MTEQQMTPHQALSFLCSAIRCGEVFDGHHSQAAEIIRAALSHAKRREFKTEQDLISFLDGLYETAGPDSSALTGQKWAPAQRAIEGIRSHAEGEAQPVALEALAFVAQAGDAISSLHLAKFEECIKTIRAALSRPEGQAVGVVEPADHQTPAAWLGDKPRRMVVTETAPSSIQSLPEGTKLYTHPAPQVAMPEGYALVPEDMLTHFRDFHDAVRTLSKTADPDGYWEHQCEVCKRIESQLAAAPTVKESLTVTPAAPAGEPAEWPEPQDAMTAHLQNAARKAGYRPHELNMQLSMFAGYVMAGMIPDEAPVSQPGGLGVAEECPECGSTALEWGCTQKGPADVADGRLRLNEVEAVFVLGCTACSETVRTMDAHEACRMLLSAPDEREIAARAIEDFADRTGPGRAAWFTFELRQEAARLRAGREGETS